MTVLMPKRRNQKIDAILRVYFTHIHMTVFMPKSRNQKLDAMYRVSTDTWEKRREVSRLYRYLGKKTRGIASLQITGKKDARYRVSTEFT